MSDRSPIPNLPPLAGVQDPAVRAYLDAFSQGWTVRNGQSRNTDEKFLTVKDLKEAIGTATSDIAGGSTGLGTLLTNGSKSVTAPGVIASAMQVLIDSIMQSRIYKILGERIALIETPEWFKGKFGAEVQSIIVKQENATNALASKTDTAITNINGNVALAQQEIKAVSDAAGATASAVTQLQTTVNGVSAAAQEALSISQSIDGQIEGAWSVKFDVNGYVVGAGLGVSGKGGSYSSDFIVRADRFSIASPMDPNAMAASDVPFVQTTTTRTIGGTTYPPGTWIKTAFIVDASITKAKIGLAEIDTLRIAGNAVTVPEGNYPISGTSISATPSVPYGTAVICIVSWSNPVSDGMNTMVISGGMANTQLGFGAGAYAFKFVFYGSGVTASFTQSVNGLSITFIGCKR